MKHFVLFLSLLTPFCLSAQRNFKEGIVVTLKGDSIRGFIDYREWDVTPHTITFKAGQAGNTLTEYGVKDLRYFEILNKEAFQRGTIDISLDPIKLEDIGGKDTSSKRDTVFLKVVLDGPTVSLFSYTDRIKERFYVSTGDKGQPYELVYREYFGEDSRARIVKEDEYRYQLKDIMYDHNLYTASLSAKISTVNYKEEALQQVILLMNKLPKEKLKKLDGHKPSNVRFFAGAGLSRTQLSFGGDVLFAQYPSSTTASLLPKLSGGVDLLANPNIGRLYFRMEAGAQAEHSITTVDKSKEIQYTYEMTSTTFSIVSQFNYNVYHSDMIKVPVGLGFGYNYSIYSKNLYKESNPALGTEGQSKENYYHLRKGHMAIQAKTGIIIADKAEVSFLYQPATALTTYMFFNVSSSVKQIQVCYLFHRKR